MLSRLARVLLAVDSFAQANPLFKDMVQTVTSSRGSEEERVLVVLRISPRSHVHWTFLANVEDSGYDTEVQFKFSSRDGHSGQAFSDVSKRIALLEPFDSYVRKTFIHPVAFQWEKNHG